MSTRTYIIGTGQIAREHAKAAIALTPGGSLHVYDASSDALHRFLDDVPEAVPSTSVDDMLADEPRPEDVVIIATPPASHAELTLKALRSGRHVLCEKPFAIDGQEVALMSATAREHGLMLHACQSRFAGGAPATHVRDILRGGGIGDPYALTFTHAERREGRSWFNEPSEEWRLDRERSGGGVLADWGCYDIAMLADVIEPDWLVVETAWTAQPRPTVPLGEGVTWNVEDEVGAALTFGFDDHQPVHAAYRRARATPAPPERSLLLIGTEGAVSWDWLSWLGAGDVALSAIEEGRVADETRRIGWTEADLAPHSRPLRMMRRALAEGNGEALARDAAFVFSVTEAIYATAHDGARREVRR